MPDLGALAPQIQTFFTQTAEQEARSVGFVQRVSKMTGALFLQTVTFGFLDEPEASLSELTETSQDLGVLITRQGLQTRIETAVPFLKKMFQQALTLFRHGLPLDLKTLQQFTGVFLTDSSTMTLPDSLKEEFPGCGGDGPDAAVKMQLCFEFLCGVISGIGLQAGRSPDQAYTGELLDIRAGALYLSDLGYFVLARYRTLAEQQAYFLGRLDPKAAVLTVTGEPLDLLVWLQTHPEPQFEHDVLIGNQERLPCRLVVVRVPQEVADARRRKAYATARRKGRTPSARHLDLMNWSLFMTNVPATMLTLRQVVTVYRVRWQIELIFKLWKSECALDRIAGRRRERVLSELYAKLIGIVMMQFVLAPFRDGERELSVVKVVHIIQHHVPHLLERLSNLEQFTEALQALAARFRRNGLKDKRQKRLTTYQEIRAFEATLA